MKILQILLSLHVIRALRREIQTFLRFNQHIKSKILIPSNLIYQDLLISCYLGLYPDYNEEANIAIKTGLDYAITKQDIFYEAIFYKHRAVMHSYNRDYNAALENYNKAIEYYQRVVEKYPDHKKTNDAKNRITKAMNKM